MQNELFILAGTAATLGFMHTILGPDHYLPFIVLSKARNWSKTKTLLITLLCGIGHIIGSVVLGFVGIAAGAAVFSLEEVESVRGDIAAWLMLIFGFTYLVWGIHRAIRNKPHCHTHTHANEIEHEHVHRHTGEHTHIHESEKKKITPWVLFVIFVFGPCEPLIPLVMYPAATGNVLNVAIVASIFGIATVGTMMITVWISYIGLSKLPLEKIERYSHAAAGSVIFLCGFAIKFLGL